MANRSRQTFRKRRKARERAARQRLKELRRRERAIEKAAAQRRRRGGPDPDLAGIKPGPQEPVWKMAGVLTEAEVHAIELEEAEVDES